MPSIDKILVKDFRNIASAELEFSDRFNCVSGNNGQGKTNLLDAVHYLSMARSFSSAADSFCIRHGAENFVLSGQYSLDDGTSTRIAASVDASHKTFRRDGKAYGRLSAHIGLIPVVAVTPSDASLVGESGEERRRFANQVLSQLDPAYLLALQRYNRLLTQRNRLLKEDNVDSTLLDVLDNSMSVEAATISAARRRFASELSLKASEHYAGLSGGGESISIEYETALSNDESSCLENLLASRRDRDIFLKYTTVGPQRDDFVFKMDSYPIRRCGSQGQQKSFLVALKLSQYEIMKKLCHHPPLLLLDDLFDKLDFDRTANLLSIVCGREFGQVFISDTSTERVRNIISSLGSDAKFFVARGGDIKEGNC